MSRHFYLEGFILFIPVLNLVLKHVADIVSIKDHFDTLQVCNLSLKN